MALLPHNVNTLRVQNVFYMIYSNSIKLIDLIESETD